MKFQAVNNRLEGMYVFYGNTNLGLRTVTVAENEGVGASAGEEPGRRISPALGGTRGLAAGHEPSGQSALQE